MTMPTVSSRVERYSDCERSKTVRELVDRAANVLAPVWPLKTFIAVNPLQGLESLSFETAVLEAEHQRAIVSQACPGREAVNQELIKWCSVFFDEGQAIIPMPNREQGLYRAFADLARYDRRLNCSKFADSILSALPESPDDAIALCLDRLQIPETQHEEFLRQSFAALPGWSGYVKWKEQWQNATEHAFRPATLVDFIAVRLVLTMILWQDASVEPKDDRAMPATIANLSEAESRYREAILEQLVPQAKGIEFTRRPRPDAQLVFCIDVRSEPMRRAIEAQGNYETLGFAGFFGLPVRVHGYDDEQPHDSCPVLLKPSHTVCEHAATTDAACIHRHNRGRFLLGLPNAFYRWLKYNFATPFALAEMIGPWLGMRMLARTFAPGYLSQLAASTGSALMPDVPTEPSLDDISLEQQANYGEAALRMMGLTEQFAPLVVFCGHASTTNNNAYASALDCGACGGNPGGSNARILAAILNNPAVRTVLADRKLCIPADTLFLAAEHDTTTDVIQLDRPADASDDQLQRISVLDQHLIQAGMNNAHARSGSLGANQSISNTIHAAAQATRHRSVDWAQVRAEWGLARNAAFIVGPRELTRSVNLEGRCFLHSYDWKIDDDNKFLTTILTAPMVVAQWINSQYLFSTLDNTAYGSGSKITQNVTGKIGVMQGNASDLMHGLPLQSVYASDDQPYHEPLRLLTVVYAPHSKIDSIIRKQEILQRLFGNGWVTLACIEPYECQAYLLKRDLTWQRVGPSRTQPEVSTGSKLDSEHACASKT